MSRPVAIYTVEYQLVGRTYRQTVQAESPDHARRRVELRTGGNRARVIARVL